MVSLVLTEEYGRNLNLRNSDHLLTSYVDADLFEKVFYYSLRFPLVNIRLKTRGPSE